jgi:hypothetical protein
VAAPCVRPPPPLETTCAVLTRFTSPRVVALTRRHAEYVAGFPQWVAVWGIPPAVGDAVRLVVGVINACLLGWLAFAPFPESRVGACTVRLSCVPEALRCSATFASEDWSRLRCAHGLTPYHEPQLTLRLLARAHVHVCTRLCACCTVQAIAVVHLLMLSSMLTAGTEAGMDPPHITTVIETLSIEVFAGVLVLLSLRTTVDYEEVRLDCSPSRACHFPLHLTFSVPSTLCPCSSATTI